MSENIPFDGTPDPDGHKLGNFDSPKRCDWCYDPITTQMIFHVKIAPRIIVNERGEKIGTAMPKGPKNRYMHATPCAEDYARRKLVCEKCGNWRLSSTAGIFKCLCDCHPPKNRDVCHIPPVKGVSDN